MSLKKKVETHIDGIVGEFKILQVKTITYIFDDGKLISKGIHRHLVSPGQDVTNEDDVVKEAVEYFHSDDLVKRFKESKG